MILVLSALVTIMKCQMTPLRLCVLCPPSSLVFHLPLSTFPPPSVQCVINREGRQVFELCLLLDSVLSSVYVWTSGVSNLYLYVFVCRLQDLRVSGGD